MEIAQTSLQKPATTQAHPEMPPSSLGSFISYNNCTEEMSLYCVSRILLITIALIVIVNVTDTTEKVIKECHIANEKHSIYRDESAYNFCSAIFLDDQNKTLDASYAQIANVSCEQVGCQISIFQSTDENEKFLSGIQCCCNDKDNCNKNWTRAEAQNMTEENTHKVDCTGQDEQARKPVKWCFLYLNINRAKYDRGRLPYTADNWLTIRSRLGDISRNSQPDVMCEWIGNDKCLRWARIPTLVMTAREDALFCCCKGHSCFPSWTSQDHFNAAAKFLQCNLFNPKREKESPDSPLIDHFMTWKIDIDPNNIKKADSCGFSGQLMWSKAKGITALDIAASSDLEECTSDMKNACNYNNKSPDECLAKPEHHQGTKFHFICCCENKFFCRYDHNWMVGEKERMADKISQQYSSSKCNYFGYPPYSKDHEHGCHNALVQANGRLENIAYESLFDGGKSCDQTSAALEIKDSRNISHFCKEEGSTGNSCMKGGAKLLVCCCEPLTQTSASTSESDYCNSLTTADVAIIERDVNSTSGCLSSKKHITTTPYGNETLHSTVARVSNIYKQDADVLCYDSFSQSSNGIAWHRGAVGANFADCKDMNDKNVSCAYKETDSHGGPGNTTTCCCKTSNVSCNDERLDARAYYIVNKTAKTWALKTCSCADCDKVLCPDNCYNGIIYEGDKQYQDPWHKCTDDLGRVFGSAMRTEMHLNDRESCFTICGGRQNDSSEWMVNDSCQVETFICIDRIDVVDKAINDTKMKYPLAFKGVIASIHEHHCGALFTAIALFTLHFHLW